MMTMKKVNFVPHPFHRLIMRFGSGPLMVTQDSNFTISLVVGVQLLLKCCIGKMLLVK